MTNFGQIPQPGWYYADGDPLGTHRYWDGGQWVGGPQPVVGATAATHGTGAFVGRYANWGLRFGALLVDVLVSLVPATVAAGIAEETRDATLETLLAIIAVFFSLVVPIMNQVIYQGLTGASIGKKLVGIQLVQDANGAPAGIGLALARLVVGSILGFFSCYIYFLLDYLWPLWDEESKRLTDKMFALSVIKAGPEAAVS